VVSGVCLGGPCAGAVNLGDGGLTDARFRG